jgi:hypothetical protein
MAATGSESAGVADRTVTFSALFVGSMRGLYAQVI